MFELSIEQIKMVSGGAADQSGNNYGDSGNQPSKDRFFTESPGWGATVGGTIGSKGGILPGLGGAVIGHYIETRDYYQMGENHKNYVHNELKNGLFHNDWFRLNVGLV